MEMAASVMENQIGEEKENGNMPYSTKSADLDSSGASTRGHGRPIGHSHVEESAEYDGRSGEVHVSSGWWGRFGARIGIDCD